MRRWILLKKQLAFLIEFSQAIQDSLQTICKLHEPSLLKINSFFNMQEDIITAQYNHRLNTGND